MSNLLANISQDQCRNVEAQRSANTDHNSGGGYTSHNSGYTGGGQAVTVSSSVGLRSANIPPDVTNIQKALNRISPAQGGPTTPLTPDGSSGQKTVEAIQNFQLHHFGWNGADGKIDPNGETLARINHVLSRPQEAPPQVYPPDAPEVTDTLDKTMKIHLVEARQWVHETRYELMALEPFIDSLAVNSETYARLNNVFAIGQSPNRRQTLRKILQVYNDMESAFQRHDAGQNPVFELYRGKATGTYSNSTGAIIAFTSAAGFYRNGAERNSWEFGKTRDDKIYLMPSGMVNETRTDLRFYISVLIHELAHFVGGWHSVGTIEDWSRHETLIERLRAANCYQHYAQSVRYRTNGS